MITRGVGSHLYIVNTDWTMGSEF